MKTKQLSRTLRSEATDRVPPIDPVEHVGKLRGRDREHTVVRRRPDEAPLLQSFGVERHTQTVMPKNLDQVTSGASKNVQITGMRIAPQRFLDLESQAIHAAPHIGAPDRKPDPYARGDRYHRRSNTSSTRRNACRSKPLPTQTRYLPATSISIFSATVDGCAATSSCSAVITTGISWEADGSDRAGASSR